MVKNFKNTRKGKSNIIVSELKEILKKEIPFFVKSQDLSSKNENEITIGFISFMMERTKALERLRDFNFMNEYPQQSTHSVDIGVLLGAQKCIYVIEAKILPTPQGAKRPEHEYVYKSEGDGSGGIQRFRELKHGLNEKKQPFTECGMFAYIKDGTFPTWETQVNQWIDDIRWGNTEYLNNTHTQSPLAVLESTHKRTDGTDIKLTHFWIKIPK